MLKHSELQPTLSFDDALRYALCLIFNRYRKVISNVCEGGVDLQQNVSQHHCPLTAPKGLQITIKGESLAVKPGEDVSFIVKQEQVTEMSR